MDIGDVIAGLDGLSLFVGAIAGLLAGLAGRLLEPHEHEKVV